MAQAKQTITKVEMYDFAWGGYKSLPEMGAENSGVFTSATAANRYAREIIWDLPSNTRLRITTQDKASFVLRKVSSRIVRTTA